jgi:hypothetical protein
MNTLFVSWQDPVGRSWFPVGRLHSTYGQFRFDYTRGAIQASEEGEFRPFSAFPDFLVTYQSERLFPFFGNRLLSRSRREYSDFVKWVRGHDESNDPVALLAQSGGTRMTDSLELFPKPEKSEDGVYHLHFFAHGLSHMPPGSSQRAEALDSGESLLVMKDIQNRWDPGAVMLRTGETYEQDIFFVGFVPRYLA